MSLEKLFEAAVLELKGRDILYAVAGGFAASLYRGQPRLTLDVDITIVAEAGAMDMAVAVIEALGLQAGIARKADLAGGPLFAIRRRNTEPCIVVGRPVGGATGEGVDILLPGLPWVSDAVRRAQANAVDFGFGPVPALTLEYLVVSKLYALTAARVRAKDLDDLQSILGVGHEMDMAYLAGQMQRFEIVIPRAAAPFLPDALLKIARGILRSKRNTRPPP